MHNTSHKGMLHKLGSKHPASYVQEPTDRHSMREQDTIDRLWYLLKRLLAGKCLNYRALIRDGGLSWRARA